MKYFGLILLFFSTATASLFSQEKYIQHQISQGETISTIAEKYQVSQKVIFELNPKASGVLKLKSVLKIPNKNYKKELAQKELAAKMKHSKTIEYEVLPKETLYGIAKKHNLSVDDIKKSNPSIELGGLKVGKKIKLIVPANFLLTPEIAAVDKDSVSLLSEKTTESKETQNATTIVAENKPVQPHTVQASETKYGVSKKYNISVAELEQLNPSLINKNLAIGQILNVPLQDKQLTEVPVGEPSSATTSGTVALEVQDQAVAKVENTTTENGTTVTKSVDASVHQVMPKETKFGIAKKYNISVAELERLNPSIKNTLRVGLVLKINEGTSSTTDAIALESTKNETVASNEESSTTKFFGDFTVADHLIEKASDNLGIRYRSGGTTRAGFDCSGLVYTTFDAFDIKLPRSSIEQSNIGFKIAPQEAQKGDLIFFKTRGSGRINHVGMVVEVEGDEIKFIHSSTSNGVIISSTKENYYHRNFAQINRVLK
jgi:cell wall-associated NlpC family hydrolase